MTQPPRSTKPLSSLAGMYSALASKVFTTPGATSGDTSAAQITALRSVLPGKALRPQKGEPDVTPQILPKSQLNP